MICQKGFIAELNLKCWKGLEADQEFYVVEKGWVANTAPEKNIRLKTYRFFYVNSKKQFEKIFLQRIFVNYYKIFKN